MIIYWSMLLMVLLGYLFDKRKSKKTSKIIAILVFSYMIFWVGIRDGFVDTTAYIRAFNQASINDLSSIDFSMGSGWGFELIMIIFKIFISSNYHMWLMFIAIITGTCIARFFYKYSDNFYFSLFLFIATTNFAWMMNGIRQFLVVAILLETVPLLENQKKWTYFLVILICSTIHFSCIFLIPLYFIFISKPWNLKTILLLVGVLFIITSTSSFNSFLNTVLRETTYSDSVEQFMGDDGVNPLRFLVYSITTILAFVCNKCMKNESKEIQIAVNMSIITTSLYAIGMVTSGILMGRLPIYTQIYQYVLLPKVINKGFTKDSSKLMYALCIVCYILYFYIMSKGMYYTSEITGRIF